MKTGSRENVKPGKRETGKPGKRETGKPGKRDVDFPDFTTSRLHDFPTSRLSVRTSRLSRLHDFPDFTSFRSDFRFPDFRIKLSLTNILICYMYFSDLQIINHIFCKLFIIYNNRNEKNHRPPRGCISSPGLYYNPGLEILSHAPGAGPAWSSLVPGRRTPGTRGGGL